MIWQQYCWTVIYIHHRFVHSIPNDFYFIWLFYFKVAPTYILSTITAWLSDFVWRMLWKIIHSANDLAPKYLYFPESYLVWPVLIIFYTPYLSTNQIRCYILVLFITQIVNIKYRKNIKENDKLHTYQLATGEIYDELSNKIRRSSVWPFVC